MGLITAENRTRIPILSLGLFSFVALTWGGSYIAITIGLRYVPPVLFAAGRLYTAATVLLPMVALYYDKWIPQTYADWLTIAVAGVFVTGGANGFLFYGQQFTTSAVAAVIFALNPVLATAFAWLLVTDERLGPIEIFGILLGLVGVGIIANPDPSNLLAPGNLGTWFVFGGAACLALGSVLSRRFTSRLPTLVTTGWGLLLGAILLHLCSLGLGEPTPNEWPVALLAAVSYLGSVATAGAYSAYFDLIGRVGAVRTALVSYAVPVVTALASWFLLGEVVTIHTVVGFLVIAVGFLLTERYQLRTSLRWMLAHRQSTNNRDD